MKLYSNLRMLTDAYQQVQKIRIGIGNRISALERGQDQDGVIIDQWQDWHRRLSALERDISGQLSEEMEYHPAWPFLERVKGAGLILSGQLVGLIGDIGDFDNISKLWRYAVGAPVEGKVEKKTKGEKLHYSPRLKRLLYVLGSSFLRHNSPYRKIYDEAKEHYRANRDWTKLHVHYAAMRKMEKVFLAHLWLYWRRAVNLPTRPPWVLEHTEHTTMLEMEEFLEPIKESQ